MNDRQALAQGIRRAILKSGQTEATIALKLGVNQSTLAKWRTGASMPNSVNIRRVAAYFDVDINDLCTGYTSFAESDN